LNKNLQERLGVNHEVVNAFKKFSILNIANVNEETISDYGQKEIDTLSLFFAKSKINPSTKKPYDTIIEKECLTNEWKIFKQYALTHFKSFNQAQVWKHFHENLQERFPYLYKLFFITNVIPMSSAICERGFSQINLIKTDIRNLLGNHC